MIYIINLGDYKILKNITVVQSGMGSVIGTAIYLGEQHSFQLNPSLFDIIDVNDREWFRECVYKTLIRYIDESR